MPEEIQPQGKQLYVTPQLERHEQYQQITGWSFPFDMGEDMSEDGEL